MSTIQKQIAALRRERGLTQEQLGQLVGVSAQAVSKWETGGTPDVELLPSIADHLGVTIDTLFGREKQEIKKLPALLDGWLSKFPEEERMSQLFSLLAETFQSIALPGLIERYHPLSFTRDGLTDTGTAELWLRSMCSTDSGMLLGILDEETPLYLLLPQFSKGYETVFADNDAYRKLFSALCLPGSLEILRYLYAQKPGYYTTDAIVNRCTLSEETVKAALVAMTACNLLEETGIVFGDRSENAYRLHDNFGFVPFLIFARWLMEKDDCWLFGWMTRERTILGGREK